MVYFIYMTQVGAREGTSFSATSRTVTVNKTVVLPQESIITGKTMGVGGINTNLHVVVFKGITGIQTVQTNLGNLASYGSISNKAGLSLQIFGVGSKTNSSITIKSVTFSGTPNTTIYMTGGIEVEIPAPISNNPVINTNDLLKLGAFYSVAPFPDKFLNINTQHGTTIERNDGAILASKMINTVSSYDSPPHIAPTLTEGSSITQDFYNAIIHAIDKDHPRDNTNRFTIGINNGTNGTYTILKV